MMVHIAYEAENRLEWKQETHGYPGRKGWWPGTGTVEINK